MHSAAYPDGNAFAEQDELSSTSQLFFHIYKSLISPILHTFSPSSCLYLPTCSEYTYVALTRFGAVRGGWLSLLRLLRCHPLAKGGFDPVPAAPIRSDRLP